MIVEQARSEQMYVPMVLPSRPACPAFGTVNSDTWLPGWWVRHSEHMAEIPRDMLDEADRRTMPNGLPSRQ